MSLILILCGDNNMTRFLNHSPPSLKRGTPREHSPSQSRSGALHKFTRSRMLACSWFHQRTTDALRRQNAKDDRARPSQPQHAGTRERIQHDLVLSVAMPCRSVVPMLQCLPLSSGHEFLANARECITAGRETECLCCAGAGA